MTKTDALAQIIAELLLEREQLKNDLNEAEASREYWVKKYSKLEKEMEQDHE